MIDVLFQFPNPFLTPTPDPTTLAGGGGGLGTAGYIAIATPFALAAGAAIQSWIATRAKIMADSTQATLSTLPEMLRFAHEENRDLKAKLEKLQNQLNELLPRVARLEAQLDDKKAEIAHLTQERDDLKVERDALKRENDELKASVARMELVSRQFGKGDQQTT